MDNETKRLAQLAVAWCGPLFVIGYLIFWAILGHNVPPPNFVGMLARPSQTVLGARFAPIVDLLAA